MFNRVCPVSQKLTSEIADIAEVLLRYQEQNKASKLVAEAHAAKTHAAFAASRRSKRHVGPRARVQQRREATVKAKAEASELVDASHHSASRTSSLPPEKSAKREMKRGGSVDPAGHAAPAKPHGHHSHHASKRPEHLVLESTSHKSTELSVYVTGEGAPIVACCFTDWFQVQGSSCSRGIVAHRAGSVG